MGDQSEWVIMVRREMEGEMFVGTIQMPMKVWAVHFHITPFAEHALNLLGFDGEVGLRAENETMVFFCKATEARRVRVVETGMVGSLAEWLKLQDDWRENEEHMRLIRSDSSQWEVSFTLPLPDPVPA